MKVPKSFVSNKEEIKERLFEEWLEKNCQRENKLESIEDLILKDLPEQLISESYGHPQPPRYATEFNDIDTELDRINFNELEIEGLKKIHVTNIDVGLYKLDILIIEADTENEIKYYYEDVFNYEKDMNEGRSDYQVRHLTKDNYLVLLVVPYSEPRLTSHILKEVYDYYKDKFDMKRINVRKVVELI